MENNMETGRLIILGMTLTLLVIFLYWRLGNAKRKITKGGRKPQDTVSARIPVVGIIQSDGNTFSQTKKDVKVSPLEIEESKILSNREKKLENQRSKRSPKKSRRYR
jgi:hypothetical protein